MAVVEVLPEVAAVMMVYSGGMVVVGKAAAVGRFRLQFFLFFVENDHHAYVSTHDDLALCRSPRLSPSACRLLPFFVVCPQKRTVKFSPCAR